MKYCFSLLLLVSSSIARADVHQDKYIAVLEKTNTALTNSYAEVHSVLWIVSITIGLLTLFAGFAAIFASFYIYRQSKDFRDKQAALIEAEKAKSEEAREETKKQIEALANLYQEKIMVISETINQQAARFEEELKKRNNEFDKIIAKQKEKLNLAKTEEEKSEIESKLNDTILKKLDVPSLNSIYNFKSLLTPKNIDYINYLNGKIYSSINNLKNKRNELLREHSRLIKETSDSKHIREIEIEIKDIDKQLERLSSITTQAETLLS